MRTRCSGNSAMTPLTALLLCAAGCSAAPQASSPAPTPAPAPAPAKADAERVMALRLPGRNIRVPVTVDPATIDPTADHETRLLASAGNIAIALDSYASRPQSMSRCQAGEERWLRVIDIAAARQRYAKLIESCLKDVVPGDPLLTGPDGAGAYTVNLVSEPSLRIAADGTVAPVSKAAP